MTTKRLRSPWLLFAALLLLLLILMPLGWWRAGAAAAQVQVPLFSDAHDLFPRPWTQAQSAPGAPDAAPVAIYGPNHLSQSFRVGSDGVGLLALWLDGPAETAVSLSLSTPEDTAYTADFTLDGRPRRYAFRFPRELATAGRDLTLTLAAPEATAGAPLLLHTAGGDRLGGAVRLNEFHRPGNLDMAAYARGWPGRWWLNAVGEQLLPDLFRLRLQQYKPLKGPVFSLLLLATVLLTLLFLAAAAPGKRPFSQKLGWLLVVLLAGFLVWQVGAGRLRLFAGAIPLQEAERPLPLADFSVETPRLVDDLSLTLWTARRRPEARFVSYDQAAGHPALRVPADSSLIYRLTIPPNGRFRAGVMAGGEGELRYAVRWLDVEIASGTVAATEDVQWINLDLGEWTGLAGDLRLVTTPLTGEPEGIWLQPQLLATTDWLHAELPETAVAVDYRLGERVELAGYAVAPAGEQLQVTLYWRALAPLNRSTTVFVHLLDADGEIVAQQDAPPLNNAYPLPVWPPGLLVADTHLLPAAGGEQLGVGLYDSETLARWPAVDGSGDETANGRILLQK